METEGRLETVDREGLGDARAARPNPSLAREAVAQGQQKHFLTPALEGKLGTSGGDEDVTSPEPIKVFFNGLGEGG